MVSPTVTAPAFRVDSLSLGEFSYNWYCLAYQDVYEQFQPEAVHLPFQCSVQDSFGGTSNLRFNTIAEMAAWRRAHPQIFLVTNNMRGPQERVVFDGRPECTFDSKPTEHLDHLPDSDKMMLTYIAPFYKGDYFFQKQAGRWKVFRSVHRQYSTAELQKMPEKKFEDFLLRYLSDTSFRLQHTRIPLLYRIVSADGEFEPPVFLSRKKIEERVRWTNEQMVIYMAVYPNHSGQRAPSDLMYLCLRSEGGACFQSTFRKTGGRWMLSEELNCSN